MDGRARVGRQTRVAGGGDRRMTQIVLQTSCRDRWRERGRHATPCRVVSCRLWQAAKPQSSIVRLWLVIVKFHLVFTQLLSLCQLIIMSWLFLSHDWSMSASFWLTNQLYCCLRPPLCSSLPYSPWPPLSSLPLVSSLLRYVSSNACSLDLRSARSLRHSWAEVELSAFFAVKFGIW